MADQDARVDGNRHPTMTAVDATSGEIRRVTVNDLGELAVTSGGASSTTLTGRMMARTPASAYHLWLDLGDASHLYVLEAPEGAVAADTGFRGVRVTLDADGNPVGEVEVNTAGTLTFDNRTTDAGWG